MNRSPSSTTNKSPFWVGIHEIYPNNVWGYQTDGLKVQRPFLVNEEQDQYDYKCAAMDDLMLVKKSCKLPLAFACEAGKVFSILHDIVLHLIIYDTYPDEDLQSYPTCCPFYSIGSNTWSQMGRKFLQCSIHGCPNCKLLKKKY